jgi:PAS domain S-box-containing protein
MTEALQFERESLQRANEILHELAGQREASEHRIRMLADNLPALISYIDHEQRFSFCNAFLGEVFGIDPDELLGRTMLEVRGARRYAQIKDKIEAVLRGERVGFEGEEVVGERVYRYQTNYIPDRAADGTVRGFYAMTFDITALKNAERQLRTVMESSPLGMYVTDADGKCTYTNPAWQRIAGMTLEQSLGDGWGGALHPDDRQRVYAEWSAAAASNRSYRSEHRFLRPGGSVAWTRVHAAEMQDAGHIVGYVGMVEDISEKHLLDVALAQKAEELARSNGELEQFAYVASHDLQEPLRMVTSYTQLLRKRYSERFDEDASEFMDYIVEGGQRMQTLITDLLELSRVNTTQRALEPVDFARVLDDSLAMLKMRIAETGALIGHDPLPVVSGDARQLGQVMLNLIGNALKFRGSETPQIHISAQREEGTWHIAVADNGIGIDARYFERIFVIFQRLHTRSEYAGTGIGLAICKKIVERHGGRIWVESVIGKGTTFHFTLMPAPQLPYGPVLPETTGHSRESA